MDRINGANTIDLGNGRRGFRKKNKAAGVSGTELTDVWLNNIQEEVVRVIEAGGIPLNAQATDQLYLAILNLIALNNSKLIYATSSGPPNAYQIAPNPPFTTLASLVGLPLFVRFHAANTAASTLVVNNLAATALTKPDGGALVVGDIQANRIGIVQYDGTAFRMLNVIADGDVTPQKMSPGGPRWDGAGNFATGYVTPPQNTNSRFFSPGDVTLLGSSRGFLHNMYWSNTNNCWQYASNNAVAGGLVESSGNFIFLTTGIVTGTAGQVAPLVEIYRLKTSGFFQPSFGVEFTDGTRFTTALPAVGTIGSYSLLDTMSVAANPGDTFAGSALRYSGINARASDNGNSGVVATWGTNPPGTWRCMGMMGAATATLNLFMRIA